MIRDFIDEMALELDRAENKFPALHSYHEAYSVILEELDEFWDEVRTKDRDWTRARKELIQIATMAWRAARDLGMEE